MSEEELIRETMMLDYSQLVMHNVYMIKENKRLHSIIKEVREYIKVEKVIKEGNTLEQITNYEKKLLGILDKEGK